MNLLRLLLLLAFAGGAYHWWHKHQIAQVEREVMSDASDTGFVPMQRPMNTPTGAVLIFAPPNCPSATAQRARALARGLEDLGIPHVVLDEASFDIDGSDPALMARFRSVMEGKGPPVFVRNRAKAAPTMDEVLAEYRSGRRR
nr:hypothetical protein [Dyella sp. ASV24]